MTDYTNISTVDTCKEIRVKLKELFPKTKFTVRKDREYSITVSWQDGPASPEVQEVLDRFRGYVTDDVYYETKKRDTFYRDHQYWSYNLEYISTNRTHSRKFVEAITRYIVEKHGLTMPTITTTRYSTHIEDDDQSIGGLMLSQAIHNFMRNASAIWLKDPKSPAQKFRQWADGLQKQIDDKCRPRPTHTHRMARMANSAREDARVLELQQSKFRALADAWDAGLVPDPLRYVSTKAQVMKLARSEYAPTPWVCNDNYDNKDYKAFTKAGLGAKRLYADAYRELALMGDENAGKKTDADILKEKEIALTNSKIPGFFPTPDNLIDQMLNQADIQSGDTVLEPSAGKGNIAEKIKSAHPDADLDVVEWNYSLSEILKLKQFNVIGSDCFELKPETKQYDVIVSNPPFKNYADIDHVLHYYGLLKPGGRLVSIMSASPFQNATAKASQFREWLDDVGYGEELPDGAFLQSERKTGVKTYMIVVDKPERYTDTDKWVKDVNDQARKLDAMVTANRHKPTGAVDNILKPETVKFKQIASSGPTTEFNRGDFVKNNTNGKSGWIEKRHKDKWKIRLYDRERTDLFDIWDEQDLEHSDKPSVSQLWSDIKLLEKKRDEAEAKVMSVLDKLYPESASTPAPDESPAKIATQIETDLKQAIKLIKPLTFKVGQQVSNRLLPNRYGTIIKIDTDRGCLVDRKDEDKREWWGSDDVILIAPVNKLDDADYTDAQKHIKPIKEPKEVPIEEPKPVQLTLF